MCGIYCSVEQCDDHLQNDMQGEVKNILNRRGPDSFSIHCITNENLKLVFAAFVLWQQGDQICHQPVRQGDIILVFNGDVFNIDYAKDKQSSDTAWLARSLSLCKSDEEICRFLQSVEGPYSLIFYNKSTQKLYFCRDSLGRNSLILEKELSKFRLISTSYHYPNSDKKAAELPPLGLFVLNITCLNAWKLYPWGPVRQNLAAETEILEKSFGLKLTLETHMQLLWFELSQSKKSFDFYEICKISTISWDPFKELLKNEEVLAELERFSSLLQRSVQIHTSLTPPFCKNCIQTKKHCSHAKVAILFSGGIDCTILAVLADKFTPSSDPINLINVAFERVGEEGNWNVPDRISANDSLLELRQLCPSRKWNFVEVNISRADVHTNLENHIKHLIYPRDSVLDESIGCAFWFASRGKGLESNLEYETPARIILVGSGADELFGGYIRHRNAYCRYKGDENEKLLNLHKELENDWARLPSRNLARDDRIIADSGRTLRVPFIEEHLVQYIRSLSPSQRCCFLLKEGIGEKLFLRLYGFQLGLKSAASMKKRAIQFGSRIANKKQNASDKSQYLQFW